MTEVISVRFRNGTKNYYFDPKGLTVEPNQYVVVETAQGLEYACCAEGNHSVSDQSVVQPLRPVVRIATENDHKAAAYNRKREKEAFDICEKKIAAHKLEMKLVNVECNFEGNKIIFFFTAEGRVDFRELVKDLAGVFRARIELRQIGVRDEAKMLGGLGICGRPLCCSQFLEDFIPVSIKMAKTQNLSLNPTKISGTCGRLMCCLKYEQNAYEDAVKRMPKNDSFVDTPDGIGNVSNVDLLREQVTVRLDASPESPKKYRNSEIRVLRNGKGSRDGIEIPAQRPARYEAPAEESQPTTRRVSGNFDVISIPSVIAEPHDAEFHADGEKQNEGQGRRRRHRGGRRGGDKAKSAEKAAPVQEKAEAPKAEKAEKSEKRPAQNRHRKGQQPNGQPKDKPAAKTEKAEKPIKVEKVAVRPSGDTTAAKKAAADQAHRQQSAAPAEGKEGGSRRRRPRHRRGGGKGGSSGSTGSAE